MKKILLGVLFFSLSFQAQTNKYWSSIETSKKSTVLQKNPLRDKFPSKFDLYQLDIDQLRSDLFDMSLAKRTQKVTIALPNSKNQFEEFELVEASNFDPQLQAQFPEIRSYSGKGLNDKYATLKLSISPYGVSTMVFRLDSPTEFMECISRDAKTYAFYQREGKRRTDWVCSTHDEVLIDGLNNAVNKDASSNKSSNDVLRTLRLAQSCTGEYSEYYATLAGQPASIAISMAAINTTIARCNAVYEKDLAVHVNLVANTTNVVYLDPNTDPYGPDDTNYNAELGAALTANIGDANFDIGHLFSAIGNNGNAGCIGCVCAAGKGTGFTTSTAPIGDNFDIDFVVHEVGHQLGANHTFSFQENNAVNYEPGSGVTIMGYAGITNVDIAAHSIDTYHAGSINQIQTNLAPKTCIQVTQTLPTNSAPVVAAGSDYTIPKSTPFMLTGSATDAEGDPVTYQWEQFNDATGTLSDATSVASPTKTTGPNWRSWSPTTSGSRRFPILATTLANSQITYGPGAASEALSSVARTLNFRLTARDNHVYNSATPSVGQTNFDDMIVTVSGTVGPFDVTSQSTVDQVWIEGSTQTITWSVGGTNVAYAPNVAGDQFVDILLSTDGGLTFPTVLVSNTPNDGTQTITVPNTATTNARVMVKAHSHIFYDINTQPISIGYSITNTCNSYANNTPLVIPDGAGTTSPVLGTIVANNSPNVPVTYVLTDVNVTVNLTHTYVNDVVIAINHPDTTQVMLWNGFCGSQDNFNITFSDGNPTPTCVGNDTTGTFGPASALSAFNGKTANGVWTLLAGDAWAGDTGQINSWSIELCNKAFTPLANQEFEFQDFQLFPNPNNGSFSVKFTSGNSNDVKLSVFDIRGRQVFDKSYSNNGVFDQTINLSNVQSGVYLVSVTDGVRKTTKRIVVQ